MRHPKQSSFERKKAEYEITKSSFSYVRPIKIFIYDYVVFSTKLFYLSNNYDDELSLLSLF